MSESNLSTEEQEKSKCLLTIEEDMTIYNITILKEKFENALDDHEYLSLDLSGVEEIDSSGVQLLLALQGFLNSKEKKLVIEKVSGSVKDILSLYAVNKQLMMEKAA